MGLWTKVKKCVARLPSTMDYARLSITQISLPFSREGKKAWLGNVGFHGHVKMLATKISQLVPWGGRMWTRACAWHHQHTQASAALPLISRNSQWTRDFSGLLCVMLPGPASTMDHSS